MNRINPTRTQVGLLLAAFALFGCSSDRTSEYVPDSKDARAALETALNAWQSGAAYEPITSSSPTLNVFDARWQAGQKLEKFEILEELPAEERTEFKVRLQLAGKPEETLTYIIVGIDPLLIFRDADYQRATGI
jgi:hypothetical protein